MEALPNITSLHISNFENLLVGSRSLRHQRMALLELVRISKADQIEASEDEMKLRKKQLEMSSVTKKKKSTNDIMNDPFTENGALNNLFGEE